MEHDDLPKHLRGPLATLIRYHLELNGWKRAQLAREAKLPDPKPIHNLMGTSKSAAGTGRLRNYFSTVVIYDAYFDQAPSHVKGAICELFQGAGVVPMVGDVTNTIFELDRGNAVVDRYGGLWDIVRWAAFPLSRDKEAVRLGVVRSAMEIKRGADGRASFDLIFRPFQKKRIDRVSGPVLSVHGQYLMLLGKEGEKEYPLEMFFEQFNTRASNFTGFVRRRHVDGRIFVSRAEFTRSRHKSLAELESKVGITPEEQFLKDNAEDFDDIENMLLRIRNSVEDEGRGALVL